MATARVGVRLLRRRARWTLKLLEAAVVELPPLS
jgi:hypothetical protein